MDILSGEAALLKFFYFPSENGSTLKVMNSSKPIFRKEFVCKNANRKSQKLYSLLNLPENLPGFEVIKIFSCSAQLIMKFVLLLNLQLLTIANSSLLNVDEYEHFSSNRYEKCLLLLAFSHLFAEKISCSGEFRMKKIL